MVELFRLVNHYLSSLWIKISGSGGARWSAGWTQMDSDMPLVDVIRVCTLWWTNIAMENHHS